MPYVQKHGYNYGQHLQLYMFSPRSSQDKGSVRMRLARVVSMEGFLSAFFTVGLAFGLSTPALSTTSGPQSLISSVMWQVSNNPDERFVYPPGVPAVLRPGNVTRTLRIEQYYSRPLESKELFVDLHGSWPETSDNALVQSEAGGWEGRYASITAPVCDAQKTANGYRCSMDLKISPATPTGTIGLSVSLAIFGQKFAHQNGVFWVILPEMNAQHYPKPLFDAVPSPLAIHATRGNLKAFGESNYPALSSVLRSRVMRSTVQITLEGNFSLGTGFFVANPDLVVPIFGAETAAKLRALPASTKFIVTAAHLFPETRLHFSTHLVTKPSRRCGHAAQALPTLSFWLLLQTTA